MLPARNVAGGRHAAYVSAVHTHSWHRAKKMPEFARRVIRLPDVARHVIHDCLPIVYRRGAAYSLNTAPRFSGQPEQFCHHLVTETIQLLEKQSGGLMLMLSPLRVRASGVDMACCYVR